ncbi:MAG: hypothetical protein ACK4NS_09920 [Saprospiraceae bacterium]
MKKQFFGFALLALFSLIALAACQKDDPKPNGDEKAGKIWIGLLRQYNTCRPFQGLFCIRIDDIFYDKLPLDQLGEDETFATPTITPDSSLQLTAEVEVEKLSPEARVRLLEEKVLAVEESFVVSENLVRQAFANSGMKYDGQRFVVTKGPKNIEVNGSGNRPPKITITIIIKRDGVTIIISW